MPQQLVTKGGMPRRTRPSLPILMQEEDGMSLTLARVHEICGRARHRLAAQVAAATEGEVIWIAPAWWPARINGDGLFHTVHPGRFVFVHPTRPEDMLWCMEEALRSGVAPLVVCELPTPPALTPVRRLHLAAETGRELGKCRPLGLIISAGTGGAAGVESRWSLEPAHELETAPRWTLARLRDRTAPPKHWSVGLQRGGLHLSPAEGAPPLSDAAGLRETA